jgi:hypothetical protein
VKEAIRSDKKFLDIPVTVLYNKGEIHIVLKPCGLWAVAYGCEAGALGAPGSMLETAWPLPV